MNRPDVGSVTIAESGQYSGEIDMRDFTLLAVLLPAAITGTRLRVQLATKPGGTFKAIGAAFAAATATADEWVIFGGSTDAAGGVWCGGIIKLFFDDGAGVVSTQAAARTLNYIKSRG